MPDGTKVCRFHLRNTCRDGDECPYAHTATCKHWKAGNCVAGKKCVYAHYDDAKVHKGKAISRNSSIDSTTSSERRALVESKAQYRAEKNKNRPQRDGTPVGAKKNVGVVCAWQTTLQTRRSTPLPISNRYIALDDDHNNQPSGTGPKANKIEYGDNVIDKVDDDVSNAGGNTLSTRLKTTTS